MRAVAAMLLACAAAAPGLALAATVLPPIGEQELVDHFPDGSRIETRLDADIDGDGRSDVVAVGANEDKRQIIVLLGYVGETDFGYRPVGVGALDPDPLGDAELRFGEGVLVVTDLVGGTTATQSIQRYRYDRAADRMRLIGEDATSYSRTNAHGSVAVSTNRLTGRRLTTRSELAPPSSQAALIPGKPVSSIVPRSPIYREDAPDADTILDSVAKGSPKP